MGSHQQARVVVVDDDRLHREMARDALAPTLRVECCVSAEDALAALAREPAELVVSDLTMPGLSGLRLLDRVRRLHPGTDFVVLTGNASVESAVEALRMGACDYLRKPLDPTELVLVVERTLDRRRLLADNVRLRDCLDTIEACRVLGSCLEPAEVYAEALSLALRLLGRERGFVIYRRPSIPLAHGAAHRGFTEEEGALLHRTIVQEKPVELDGFTDIASVSSGSVHAALREVGIEPGQLLVAPLRGEGSEAGVLFVCDSGLSFDEQELERVGIVTGHAASALRNAERYQKAKERAFIDDVTEVYNARYLLEAMDREIRRAERYGTELSVLFLDLDRFKLVNDRHGHLIGSQTLRQFSRVLGDCVRQVDTLARYGGDEFTILLVDTVEEVGMRVADRIRRMVAETRFDAGHGTALNLTCSVGVASYPSHGRGREALLEAADKAMYRAKSNGRNRVCSASELEDDGFPPG